MDSHPSGKIQKEPEFSQGKEALIAQAGQDPALRDLHGDFDLRLIESRRLHAVWVRSPARCV